MKKPEQWKPVLSKWFVNEIEPIMKRMREIEYEQAKPISDILRVHPDKQPKKAKTKPMGKKK